ncbi:MAG: hypothetical protein CM1200mP20_14010 [Pseudomonadota bacterium]|nr:MAG: hypothetical protein CM1200mP20_14010 [Pseudomonadota bacterium]
MFTALKGRECCETPREHTHGCREHNVPQHAGTGLRQRSDRVDVQAYFLEKIPVHQRVVLVSRIAWLMRAAGCLDVPVIATAENISALGQLLPALKTLLRGNLPVYDKLSFGLLPDYIREGPPKRSTIGGVLVGLKPTSALLIRAAAACRGLPDPGIADATASPEPNHAAGLKRMETRYHNHQYQGDFLRMGPGCAGRGRSKTTWP